MTGDNFLRICPLIKVLQNKSAHHAPSLNHKEKIKMRGERKKKTTMSLASIKKYNSLVLYTQGYHNSSGNELNNLVIQLFFNIYVDI